MKSRNDLLSYYTKAYGVKHPTGKNYVVYNGPDTKEAKRKVLGTGHNLRAAFDKALCNVLNNQMK